MADRRSRRRCTSGSPSSVCEASGSVPARICCASRAHRQTTTAFTGTLDFAHSAAATWSAEIAEEHDGYWTVHDVETGIFGSGETQEAAREDFERALHEHLDVLERQDSLSDELTAQLTYLRFRLS
jgi:predicted RNase H-like HicB family nuclease